MNNGWAAQNGSFLGVEFVVLDLKKRRNEKIEVRSKTHKANYGIVNDKLEKSIFNTPFEL